MGNTYRQTSRGLSIRYRDFGYFYKLSPPLLGILLSLLPAFFYSCGKPTEYPAETPTTRVSLAGDYSGIRSLDVFVFNNDRRQALDCYQRFDDTDKHSYTVVSSNGERLITALANSPYGKDIWLSMGSRAFLKKIRINLEDETGDNPVMLGEMSVDTRQSPIFKELYISPLTSEVRLNSIRCDFRGKEYEGENLSDVKVYLTNVNAECSIIEEEEAPPTRIINTGRLEEGDIGKFKDASLIFRYIHSEVGSTAIHPAISLRCYQSNYPDETPGTPYTRLVIEGKLSGRTYYWPINVNRDTETEPGIWRGRCYSYDVTITGKGSSSPDIPIRTAAINFSKKVTEWKEKEEYEVRF